MSYIYTTETEITVMVRKIGYYMGHRQAGHCVRKLAQLLTWTRHQSLEAHLYLVGGHDQPEWFTPAELAVLDRLLRWYSCEDSAKSLVFTNTNTGSSMVFVSKAPVDTRVMKG